MKTTICPKCKIRPKVVYPLRAATYCRECCNALDREYIKRPEVKERRRIYMREYSKRPYVKVKQNEYSKAYQMRKKQESLKLLADDLKNTGMDKELADAYALDGVLLDKQFEKRGIRKNDSI